jgi:hypothetical protein
MEYFLAIEGIGWQTDETDITAGFDGDIFATNDLDGDLASKLGLSAASNLHKGLFLPDGVSDSFDPRSGRYIGGAVTFRIQDQDEILISTITPVLNSGTSGTLDTALTYDATTIVTDDRWTVGDVLWIAGREAVLLGAEGGGAGAWTYACTRGYLGTPRGRFDTRLSALAEFSWEVNTLLHDYCRYWYDRRCILYMHVPGEVVDNCVRVYPGRLRPMSVDPEGVVWTIPTQQDVTSRVRKMRYAAVENTVGYNAFVDPGGREFSRDGQPATARGFDTTPGSPTTNRPSTLSPEEAPGLRRSMSIQTTSSSWFEKLAMAAAYNYRNRVSGGTAGMRSAVVSDPTQPQAVQDTDSRYRIDSHIQVDGNFFKALYKDPSDNQAHRLDRIITNVTSYQFGSDYRGLFDDPFQVRFLLDNYADNNVETRFPVNSEAGGSTWSRNVVDVLLMFLTSMNNEFKVIDTTGGTTTVPTFAPGSFVADDWIGYALFCTEAGSNNLGESRVISDNGTADITVDRAFSNNPTNTHEYQIRNSLYDVLPFGWGLGIHNSQIDIESFEDIRDKYLASAEVGRFALGLEDEVDMWELLLDNICLPYGILIIKDRASGKLTGKYVGHTAIQDGLDDDYTAVAAQNILEIGKIDWVPRAPAGKVTLHTRDEKDLTIQPIIEYKQIGARGVFPPTPVVTGYQTLRTASPGANGKGASLNIFLSELDTSIDNSDLETLEYNAMFNTRTDVVDALLPRMIGLLRREAAPPPQVSILLDMSFMLTVQAGTMLSLTDTTRAPLNPYTGTAGWSALVARVLSTTLVFSESNPGIRCKVELLNSITAGRVAPAADIDGKGGVAPEYLSVHYPTPAGAPTSGLADYSVDPSDIDWGLFAAGDLVDIRDKYGVVQESDVIESFGTNQVSTPGAANSGRINVVGAIARVIAAGDYITLSAWSNSNTTNMDTFAAYADAAETLGAGNDAARKYT